MSFEKLNDIEIMKLDTLRSLQRALARAELTDALARIRIAFADQGEDEVVSDPWLREQEEGVRIAILGAISQSRAEAFSDLAEAQMWLESAPSQILALRTAITDEGEAG